MPIFLFISILTKQKTWMSVVGSCAIGMLLFMMIPALTPLNATIMNPILCLAGGALFSVGLGALGTFALGKSDLVDGSFRFKVNKRLRKGCF